MYRAHRSATPAVLLTLALVSTSVGCGSIDPSLIDPTIFPEHVNVLRLQLPSFDDELEGLWLWRQSEATGEFEAVSEIRLGETVVENGQEFVEYEILDPAGNSLGPKFSSAVDRTGTSPQLALWVIRFSQPGDFKASVYNAAGESGLSSQSIPL